MDDAEEEKEAWLRKSGRIGAMLVPKAINIARTSHHLKYKESIHVFLVSKLQQRSEIKTTKKIQKKGNRDWILTNQKKGESQGNLRCLLGALPIKRNSIYIKTVCFKLTWLKATSINWTYESVGGKAHQVTSTKLGTITNWMGRSILPFCKNRREVWFELSSFKKNSKAENTQRRCGASSPCRHTNA